MNKPFLNNLNNLCRLTAAIFLCLCIICLAPAAVRAADEELPPPRSPVGAKELFACLPSAMEDLRLGKSVARSTFLTWAKSEATREFLARTASPAAGTSETTASIRFTLTDTGYFPGFNGAFLNFAPGQSEGVEKLFVQELPAIHSTPGNGVELLQVWIARRFILQIRIQNIPGRKATEALSHINLPSLKALSGSGDLEIKEPLTLYVIDELNPSKNRSYQHQWSTEKDVEESLNSSIPRSKR